MLFAGLKFYTTITQNTTGKSVHMHRVICFFIFAADFYNMKDTYMCIRQPKHVLKNLFRDLGSEDILFQKKLISTSHVAKEIWNIISTPRMTDNNCLKGKSVDSINIS